MESKVQLGGWGGLTLVGHSVDDNNYWEHSHLHGDSNDTTSIS